MGLCKQYVAEAQHLVQTARSNEDLWMRGNPNHTAQYLRRHTISRFAVHYAVQPRTAYPMVGRIGPKGMHKNVDVREYHGLFMTSSNSQDLLRSIPGNTPPEALDTGKFTRCRRVGFGRLRITASPSSIKEVRVRPSFAARFLARFRISSLILTVVLICQNISLMHQYVNRPRKVTDRSARALNIS